MKKITALRTVKGRGQRVRLFLDGQHACNLEVEVVAREGLQVGQILSADRIEELVRTNDFQRYLDAAVHYLGYRPRSESELRERLNQRGFDGDIQEAVIARLKEQGLVDDMAFAQFWTNSRQSADPRSRWLTSLELKRKGVASDIITEVVNNIDDNDNAYRAAWSKARNIDQCSYQEFRRRLGGHLKHRGFSYGVINQTIQQLWQEQAGNAS